MGTSNIEMIEIPTLSGLKSLNISKNVKIAVIHSKTSAPLMFSVVLEKGFTI